MVLRKMVYVLALVALQSKLAADCDACCRGDRILDFESDAIAAAGIAGTTGATGATSAAGLSGVFVIDHIFNLNTTASPLLILSGTPLTFNGTPLVAGTGITQTNPTTFTITKTGHYLAIFTATTSANVSGGFVFTLNGVQQSVTASVAAASSNLTLQQILNVTTVPTTLQVLVTGLGASVTLAAGTSSTISVVELSTP